MNGKIMLAIACSRGELLYFVSCMSRGGHPIAKKDIPDIFKYLKIISHYVSERDTLFL